jgi:hypothetical protein
LIGGGTAGRSSGVSGGAVAGVEAVEPPVRFAGSGGGRWRRRGDG